MTKEQLLKGISDLNCNAFIGVCYPVMKESPLAWYINRVSEEHMLDINDPILDLSLENRKAYKNEIDTLKKYKSLGVTDIVLMRGW